MSDQPTPLYTVLGVEPNALPEPKRYLVRAKLGQGAMGSVYVASDEKLGREVAVKVMIPQQAQLQADALVRFHREARAVAQLNHPSIIRIFDYSGPTFTTPFIVMERVHGVTLQAILERTVVPERIVVAIAYELAGALQHAHTAGVLHRDIKPENIILAVDGRVVLMDFGLAKGLLEDSDRQTLVGGKTKIVGTPAFCSPDQLTQNVVLTAQSDLFSLGSTCYYALTQVLPFRGDSVFEVMREVLVGALVPPEELMDLTPELAALITRLLEKAPAARPAGAAALRQALEPLLGIHGIHSPPSVIAVWMKTLPALGDTTTPLAIEAGEADAPTEAKRARSTDSATKNEELTKISPVLVTAKTVPRAALETAPPRRPALKPWLIGGSLVLALMGGAALVMRQTQAPTAPPVVTVVDDAPLPSPAAPPAAAEPVESAPQARLRVRVYPWGKVSVDGKLLGTTPSFYEAVLAVGAHDIEVTHPKFGTVKEHVVLQATGPIRELQFDLLRPR